MLYFFMDTSKHDYMERNVTQRTVVSHMHTSKEKKAILCKCFLPDMSLALKLFTQNLTQIGRIQ